MMDSDEAGPIIDGASSGYDPDLDCYYVNLGDGRYCRVSVDVPDDARYHIWTAFWSYVLQGNHVLTKHMP